MCLLVRDKADLTVSAPAQHLFEAIRFVRALSSAVEDLKYQLTEALPNRDNGQ